MSVGADLRQMREAKRITLEQVSMKTKIALKYLEAIESDQYDVFPSYTYAKGFLRAFAKIVGADPGVVTRQFEEEVEPKPVAIHPTIETSGRRGSSLFEKRRMPETGPHPTPQDFLISFDEEAEAAREETVPLKTEPFMRRDRKLLPPGSWRKPLLQATWSIGILALLIFGWITLKNHPIRFPERKAAAPVETPGSTPAATAAPKARSAVAMAVPTATATEKPLLSKAGKPAEVAKASGPAAQGPAPLTFDDKYRHIVLKGREESWVLVGMDGAKTWEFVLGKGALKTFKAEKYFTLKLGNAAGVDIWFDGEPQGVVGAPGQVVELRLPAEKK